MSARDQLLTQEGFDRLSQRLLGELHANEHLTLSLTGEDTQYVRFNGAKVRQTGVVKDAKLALTYVAGASGSELRSGYYALTLSGEPATDEASALAALKRLRTDVVTMPVDPYAVLPKAGGSSTQITEGRLLAPEEAVPALVPLMGKLDLAGIYASGAQVRASANSAGQKHWFYTESFSLDYSLYTPAERAVKSVFAGSEWQADAFKRELQDASQKLAALERPVRKIAPGEYRTYLGPSAVDALVGMFSWGFFSEQALRQGESAARFLRSGARSLSPLFSMGEDFSTGAVPRFNSEGEVAPERLPLIENGKLVNTLIHARTAQEYGLLANGATLGESLRAPSIAAGRLATSDILRKLGTGLYLSDLHYLGWSDQPEGRVTGMTRYACFWVENGELVSPIENLRWDDTLFRIFGTELEAVTEARARMPDVSTYEARSIGLSQVPGVLLRSFRYTL